MCFLFTLINSETVLIRKCAVEIISHNQQSISLTNEQMNLNTDRTATVKSDLYVNESFI